MAIATFNPSFKPLRGKVGALVFKHYADKVVVTRAPTFSGKWSPAQQDARKRFALASDYARTVCADPLLRAKYEKKAARRGLTVRSVAISAYLQENTAKVHTPERPVRRLGLARLKQHQVTTALLYHDKGLANIDLREATSGHVDNFVLIDSKSNPVELFSKLKQPATVRFPDKGQPFSFPNQV